MKENSFSKMAQENHTLWSYALSKSIRTTGQGSRQAPGQAGREAGRKTWRQGCSERQAGRQA